jgi:DNA-binding NtrC family response regulator
MSHSKSLRQQGILAIDDELDFLSYLKESLECQGYTVFAAPSAEDAIKLYEERWQEINLVLLDYLLPPTLGDFVYDELQRINPDVRVVLLTGFEEAVADKLYQKGLWGYLRKPFRLPDLLQKVQDAINSPIPVGPASPSTSPIRPTR